MSTWSSRVSWVVLLVAAGTARANVECRAQVPGAIAGSPFRGGATHHGQYAAPPGTAYGGLQWRAVTGGPVRSSPVVAGSLVLVGSSDRHLYALDRHTGAVRWRVAADGAVNSSAAADEHSAYFASLAGTVYAVELADGTVRWSARTGPTRPPAWPGTSGTDFFVSSPVLANGLVIVGAGDGVVYAFERDTGTIRWKTPTEGQVRSSPAVSDSSVYVGSFDGSVYALNLATGARRWRFDTDGRSFNSAQFGFDRRSIISSPAVQGNTVYIGSRDGHFYAIDRTSGTLRWKAAHEDGSWSIASPAVGESLIYDASSDARFVHALRAQTGERAWVTGTPGPVWSSPALAANTLFIGDGAGNVQALDRSTGRRLWTYRTGGSVHSSPCVFDGTLYVGSNDGSVYALRLTDHPLARAVFWDSSVVQLTRRDDHTVVRDALLARGYVGVTAGELAGWLESRAREGRPSVIVFAADQLPTGAAATPARNALRRYLEESGKVVWLGDPPLIWPPAPGGDRGYATIDRGATSDLLRVDHEGAMFDRYQAEPTEAGQRWGLEDWWLASWSIEPQRGVEVLATDERGRAAAWVRRYGGPEGTGFVQLNRAQWTMNDIGVLVAAAEFLPRTAAPAR